MNILMDLHTHTISSGHGYSTLQENIEAAKEIGLKYLGFSEHAPGMPGGPHLFFFQNFRCISREYGDMKLLCGAEVNIMDFEGNLDLDDDTLSRLDYAIASMHTICVKPGTMEENTRASIQAMKNPYVKILGHPDDARFLLNREEVVLAAKELEVAIEINNSSLHPQSARKGGRENITTLLNLCKKYEVPVILGSDSHISSAIGRFESAIALMKELDFPEALVLNTRADGINKIISQ